MARCVWQQHLPCQRGLPACVCQQSGIARLARRIHAVCQRHLACLVKCWSCKPPACLTSNFRRRSVTCSSRLTAADSSPGPVCTAQDARRTAQTQPPMHIVASAGAHVQDDCCLAGQHAAQAATHHVGLLLSAVMHCWPSVGADLRRRVGESVCVCSSPRVIRGGSNCARNGNQMLHSTRQNAVAAVGRCASV